MPVKFTKGQAGPATASEHTSSSNDQGQNRVATIFEGEKLIISFSQKMMAQAVVEWMD